MEKSGCIKAVFKLLHFINQQIGYKFMGGYTQVQFNSIPFIDQSLDKKSLFLFEVKKVIVATSRLCYDDIIARIQIKCPMLLKKIHSDERTPFSTTVQQWLNSW